MDQFKYKPIIKWAGGKRQLLPELLKNIPSNFDTYYEPFIGGGALLLSLYSRNLIKKAVISDINSSLYDLYRSIKENPERVIHEIESLKVTNNKDDYYRARELFNKCNDPIEKSALFIYLNRHGYNGLFRVNSKNEFNVPFGKYSNPGMPSPVEIASLSRALRSCVIMNEDFEIAVSNAKRNDFVYLDPPYVPLNRTSYFTAYTEGGFNQKDQERLAKLFKKLSDHGVKVMQSNSDTEFIRDLYSGFIIVEARARRNINSDGNKRKEINELIIKNYTSE